MKEWLTWHDFHSSWDCNTLTTRREDTARYSRLGQGQTILCQAQRSLWTRNVTDNLVSKGSFDDSSLSREARQAGKANLIMHMNLNKPYPGPLIYRNYFFCSGTWFNRPLPVTAEIKLSNTSNSIYKSALSHLTVSLGPDLPSSEYPLSLYPCGGGW